MDTAQFQPIINFIWGVADDILRDVCVKGKYRDVILPMTVIGRLDTEDLTRGMLDNVDFESYRVQLDKTLDIALEGNGELKPSQADGTSRMSEPELEGIMEIIREFNERYGLEEWRDEDNIQGGIAQVQERMDHDEKLITITRNSDEQNTRIEFEQALIKNMALIVDTHLALFEKYSSDESFKHRFTQAMFEEWRSKIGVGVGR